MRRLVYLAAAMSFCLFPSRLSGQDAPSARLPQARPGSIYSAKLKVHDRFSLPLGTCRLAGDAPAWLRLDCQRLMLTGHVPVGHTGSKQFRLEIADGSGEKVSYGLTLEISKAPEEVALESSTSQPGLTTPRGTEEPAENGKITPHPAPVQGELPQASAQPKLVRVTPAHFVSPASSGTESASMLAMAVNGLRADSAAADKASDVAARPPSKGAVPDGPAAVSSGSSGAGTGAAATPAQQAKPADDDNTGDTDLGMVRYYFTGGELLSKQDSQFSHASLFLDLHLDRSLLLPGNYPTNAANGLMEGHKFWPGLNSFFDLRLTSVPTAVQNCIPATATKGASTSNCVTSSTTSGSTVTASATSTDSYQVFLNSQKAATVGGAVYFPWMLPTFEVSKIEYSTFLAPIAKVGFVTTTEGLNNTQQSSAASDSVAPVGNSASFYKNYSFGGRIGLYKLPKDAGPGHAPAIESYVDISIGKFSNLPTLICNVSPSASPYCSSTSQHVYQQQYRFALEGLLDIPKTKGLSLGFSANLAQREIGTHHFDVLPPDDMRILFGYRFDVSKFVKTAQSAFGNNDANTKSKVEPKSNGTL